MKIEKTKENFPAPYKATYIATFETKYFPDTEIMISFRQHQEEGDVYWDTVIEIPYAASISTALTPKDFYEIGKVICEKLAAEDTKGSRIK